MKSVKTKPAPAAKADLVASEIRPGQSLELLKELHILTREGKLNQDSRRKLKQVYTFTVSLKSCSLSCRLQVQV